MLSRLLFFSCMLLIQGITLAQSANNYAVLVAEARTAYSKGDNRKALKLYTKAFEGYEGEHIDILRAAICSNAVNKYKVRDRFSSPNSSLHLRPRPTTPPPNTAALQDDKTTILLNYPSRRIRSVNV